METLGCLNSDPPKNNADGGWQRKGNTRLPTLWISHEYSRVYLFH